MIWGPLPVIAECWRSRSDAREELLATAALENAKVVTGDVRDFERPGSEFRGVTVPSVETPNALRRASEAFFE